MIQVKGTGRQLDQVILTSLLVLCLNYAFLSAPAKADCIELDVDIDAACTDIAPSIDYGSSYDASCVQPTTYSTGYDTGYDPTCDTSYGSNYGSNYGSGCGSSSGGGYQSGYGSGTCGSGLGSGCSGGSYSNPYISTKNRQASGAYYGNGSYTNNNNVGRYGNYSTYEQIYNSGYKQNTSPNGLVSTTRTPLIYGAPNTPAQTMVQPGQGPAIGDGQTPAGVTPGMGYYQNDYPASHLTNLPDVPAGIEGKYMINGMVQPYLRPPNQNPECDPGIVDPPPNFHQAPVSLTQIDQQGGIHGTAPTERWGGQTSRDLGIGTRYKKDCNSQNDFGQRLLEKPDLFTMPQASQNGPRTEYPKDNSLTHRDPSRAGAHTTSDRQGNRTFFRGPELRAKATLANY